MSEISAKIISIKKIIAPGKIWEGVMKSYATLKESSPLGYNKYHVME